MVHTRTRSLETSAVRAVVGVGENPRIVPLILLFALAGLTACAQKPTMRVTTSMVAPSTFTHCPVLDECAQVQPVADQERLVAELRSALCLPAPEPVAKATAKVSTPLVGAEQRSMAAYLRAQEAVRGKPSERSKVQIKPGGRHVPNCSPQTATAATILLQLQCALRAEQ